MGLKKRRRANAKDKEEEIKKKGRSNKRLFCFNFLIKNNKKLKN